MGWGSGVYVFDAVAAELLDQFGMPDEQSTEEKILEILYKALRDQDWDTESDSDYCRHDWFIRIQKRQGDWVEED